MRVLAHIFNASTRHITLHPPSFLAYWFKSNHETPSPLTPHLTHLITRHASQKYISYLPSTTKDIKVPSKPKTTNATTNLLIQNLTPSIQFL